MEALHSMAVFAAVIEHGSMNAAARTLGMTPSAVSQHVRKLEQQHQLALLHRTTRKLTLTEAGEVFYRSCAAMLAAARDASQQLAAMRDEPAGELRISAPTGFAGGVISRALAPLLAEHPGLRLRLFFRDERIDLVSQRIDIALRAGQQPDSSLIARHIADWPFILCASPDYLARCGQPAQPAQLAQHDWIAVEQLSKPDGSLQLSPLQANGETQSVRPRPRITSDSMLSARAFALAGMGISLQPEPEIRDALGSGQLLPVLPGWKAFDLPVYIVTPRRDVQPAKVRHAISLLQQGLR